MELAAEYIITAKEKIYFIERTPDFNIETHIKTNAVKKILNQLIHQQVYHLYYKVVNWCAIIKNMVYQKRIVKTATK